MLSGNVTKATPGLQGFDLNQPLTAKTAAEFKAVGMAFCLRYLPLNAGNVPGCLSTPEAEIILSAGLSLSAVQHVNNPGWQPSASLGAAHGGFAGQFALNGIGLVPGMNIWCDLEEVAASATAG